ncbi:hypothetical protein NKI98_17990 [Mesorhizobium sp. M0222]|uniref:hypothetical protein n=1 Tax=Mesorhizobium sp. M0222 TaxID=2956921 RepID=UPI00333D793F
MFEKIFGGVLRQTNVDDFIVIGTRPEAIKMAPVVISLSERFSSGEHSIRVVGTGQHEEIVDPGACSFWTSA